MKILFLFLDGVGLGVEDEGINPLARARMPHLRRLLDGQALTWQSAPYDGERASLRALDARLGVEGLPQSATGQAALLTGVNAPRQIGAHYGPKPNAAVAEILHNGNLFKRLGQAGRQTSFLNAYPQRYFEAIASGRRLYSAIPMAATSAGLALKTAEELSAGQALSADFTNAGWREHLSCNDMPLLRPGEAGKRLADLSMAVDFAFFEYWASDYAGHEQDMAAACTLLETFDEVLGGLLRAWDDRRGLVVITSDHGNLEDLSTRRHTLNPAPALVIGSPALRQGFCAALDDLTDIPKAIVEAYEG